MGKMAGAHMTINEHWAKVSSELPGGLWWENLQLKMQEHVGGLGNKKATEWNQLTNSSRSH